MTSFYRRSTHAVARLFGTDPAPWLNAGHLVLLGIWMTTSIAIYIVDMIGEPFFLDPPYSQWEVYGGLGGRFAAYYLGRSLISPLPIFVAHGQTRRQFVGQAALVGTTRTNGAAVVMAAGLLIEAGIYRALDLAHLPNFDHLFSSPNQFWLVFIEFWLLFGLWAMAGALIAAGRYRNRRGLGVVASVVLVVLAESAVGTLLPLPLGISFDISPPVAVAVVICAGAVGLGLAATWKLVRNVPIRTGTA